MSIKKSFTRSIPASVPGLKTVLLLVTTTCFHRLWHYMCTEIPFGKSVILPGLLPLHSIRGMCIFMDPFFRNFSMQIFFNQEDIYNRYIITHFCHLWMINFPIKRVSITCIPESANVFVDVINCSLRFRYT